MTKYKKPYSPYEIRKANVNDAQTLAGMNQQLIEDEGHNNPMSLVELENRMRNWLKGDYETIILVKDNQPLAYGLYRCQEAEPSHDRLSPSIYLRQLFVHRDHRRQGLASKLVQYLREQGHEIHLEVLSGNQGALKFYQALGFNLYSHRLILGCNSEI